MALSINNKPITYRVKCPFCKKDTPAHEQGFYQEGYSKYIVAKCLLCNEIFFIKEKGKFDQEMGILIDDFDLSVYPLPIEERIFSKEIQSISPNFQNLYNEALKSEQYELNNICGLAYRRSFEFLIRDFACYLNPDKTNEISKDNDFSNVICNRIPNKACFDDIKDISKRTWWIGSDYAHYNKKYEENDIDDIKNMIDLIVSNIESYVKTEKYKRIVKK